jgi:hypothetical protein
MINMPNFMVDLETLSTEGNAAIVSIGVVQFSGKGLGEEFYRTVDWATSIQAGGDVNTDTLKWWMGQSDAARQAILKKGSPSLFQALQELTVYFAKCGADKGGTIIWGNGGDFDNPILAAAYKSVNLEVPWNFWNNRCYRTMKEMLGKKIPMEKSGVQHNALADAKQQALHLVKILNAMSGRG